MMVCHECLPELHLDTPASAGHYIRQVGHCRHVHAALEAAASTAQTRERDKTLRILDKVVADCSDELDRLIPGGPPARQMDARMRLAQELVHTTRFGYVELQRIEGDRLKTPKG